MHLLLTDRLVCPRCGPGFGLILRSDRLEDRRVLGGALGCPNCRDRFPIEDGFADLRPPPRASLDDRTPSPPPEPGATDRLAALLGVVEGPGNIGLFDELAAHADGLADRVPGVEVVAVAASARAAAEREGVSRLTCGAVLPFRPWTFRALAAAAGEWPLEELVGLVGRGGRIVLSHASSDDAACLARAPTRLLMRDADWIVAVRETS